MAILSAADYPAIRAAIAVGLTAADIPDDTIALGIYSGAADAQVEARLAPDDYDTIAAGNQPSAKRAAIYYCAALLYPAVPQRIDRAVGDVRVRVKDVDVAAAVAALEAKAAAELAFASVPATVTATMPTLFGVVRGRRARADLI